MIKFNFQKISRVPLSAFHKRKEISDYLVEVKEGVQEKNYSVPESFLNLPQEAPSKLGSYYDLILLVGVGGSSLGAQAVYEALESKKSLKKMMVLDSLNPLFFKKAIEAAKKTKKGKLAVLFISKTGNTFETTANFFALFKKIQKVEPKVFVISAEDSPLWLWGRKNNFLTLPVPEKIGGRYSVLSNVGLVPLKLAGVDVKELLLGAKEANKACLADDPVKNPAMSSALTIFYHYQKGKNIYGNLVFPPDLEYFGKWYVQLMGECLGKDGKGMTPTVTTGTTDFHAIGQLYFDGPRDKLINFIFAKDPGQDYTIENLEDFSGIFPGMAGKKIWQLNSAIFEGVKRAYLKKEIPFTETILDKLDEKNLGYLLEMRMIEIIFLGKLMRVNAFDQPGVDLYKKETRKILAR